MSDVFRSQYRELTEQEKELIKNVKDAAQALYNFYDTPETTRELSLAKTKLEESVMWAVKSLTK